MTYNTQQPADTRLNATIVVGGQYGSEGKGVVVMHLMRDGGACVRVGGPNAGHTFWAFGRDWKQQQLPCGWPRGAACMLGAGAVINPSILLDEVTAARQYINNIHTRVLVDGNAVILRPHHHEHEGGACGDLNKLIGSTGEGVGAARIMKISRDPQSNALARDVRPGEFVVDDIDFTSMVGQSGAVRASLQQYAGNIIIEGTQGTGLSLHHGQWPYVTSHDTTASTIAGDVGIGPHDVGEVVLVLRTFPIRVAGNSGPMLNEVSWHDVSAIAGRAVTETTTVTRRTRRVGMWDWELARRAVALNSPDWIFLTFCDYLHPDAVGITEWERLPEAVRTFACEVEQRLGVRVGALGTGRRSPSEPFAVIRR